MSTTFHTPINNVSTTVGSAYTHELAKGVRLAKEVRNRFHQKVCRIGS